MPGSLRGRFVLIMIIGVLSAQLASYALWSAQARSAQSEQLDEMASNLAYSISSTVRFFRSLPYEYRHIVLEQLRDMGGTRFFVSVNEHRIPVIDIGRGQRKALLADRVRSVLRQELGIDNALVEFSSPDTLRVFNNEVLIQDLPPRWGQHTLLTGPASSPILVIQMSLEDDAWLYVATTLPMAIDERSWLSADRLFVLFVVLVTVLGLSFWVIRGVTRPLARLARAARQLGDDLEAVPLSERGPREVAASARAFNRMQERIRSQIKERERLFSAISHDLKTPITRLRLRAEMLDDDEQRERFCASLDELDTLVKGALASVRGLDLDESWEVIDVRKLLVSLAQELEVQGGKVSVAGEAAMLRVKPLSFKRCLANLLENAIFHGDRAAVTIRHGAESLEIVIRDHGPGIPDDQFERVFAPFVRLEPSRSRNTGGSGLGLSIARHIAHAHGAALNLANHPSGGLVVTLHFPCRTMPCTSLR
ncbi:signal transduction histidine kinase [Modicisalibacter xianhensis]|uniref:histidine kinase n=1 Tax=Modicisalibacter xianhensis TaxID=442341 RepID=A0A4R8G5N5_9GAMM|nr:ATP-binding protein [Halomonas xianhensis]TDX32069.1 signal transduction histidine kinase [Halomonas xianhensis]